MTQHDPRPVSEAAAPFLGLARRVTRRLRTARWLEALRASALPVFGLAAAGLGAAWLTGLGELPWIARDVLPAGLVLVALWSAGCALWARLRAPDETAALALFDERARTHELFLSAYSLARDPARGPGGELHLRRARAELAEALARLEEAVPLRAAPAGIVAPFAFLVLAFFGLPAVAQAPAEPDATREAAEVGASLDEEARTLDRLEQGLTEAERRKLEALKDELAKSAQKMTDLDREKTARDVLEELEGRALEAEKLAEMLGADNETPGSAMLAELERHADTAELAGALRGQELDDASTEAGKLARRLRAEDLSLEARNRIQNAFAGGLEAASAQDLETLLGRHMTTAQGELEQQRPARAADEFDRLARKYQQMAQRMRSMQALERLAQNLRASGQKALGNDQGAMTKIAALSKAGLARVGNRPVQLQVGTPPTSGHPSAGTPGSTPGSGRPPPPGATSKQPGGGTPVPGSAAPHAKPCCPT